MHKHLISIGFIQTNADHCVYINPETGVILAIWVDDLVIIGKEIKALENTKQLLHDEFEMKDLGELKYFLGICVERNRMEQSIHINQQGYINQVLERFNMQDSKSVSTPIATGTKLLKSTNCKEDVDTQVYQSKVGSEMYGMLCTCPDIAYGISQVSQHCSNPNSTHDAAVKRIMRYLKPTANLGITYKGKDGLNLKGYSDADWGAGEDRKSISGYVFILAGGAISWSSKKQSGVALSSTEAEYTALLQAVKESIWIRRLLQELGREAEDDKVIYDDNQGAIALAHNPEYHVRTKHIDIQYHFVREQVEKGEIELVYCPTEEMVADQMTKALAKERHWKLCSLMGLEDIELSSSQSGSVEDAGKI